jgi:homogentisate 1,2-dioxygenase
MTDADITYLTGFGSEHESEAVPGVLPERGNSPQKPAHGLYVEQLSGAAFTAPRADNVRSWLYRRRPSVRHLARMSARAVPGFETAPNAEHRSPIGQLKWRPADDGPTATTWLDGIETVATNGDAHLQLGGAIHTYRFAPDRERATAQVFVDTDGELVIVPADGVLSVTTEFGPLRVGPGELALIPRGANFSVDGIFSVDGVDAVGTVVSGWVCENYGQRFRLPDPGVVGLNALAMPKDFRHPTARPVADSPAATTDVVIKADGRFGQVSLDHTPFDVVAWRGNYAPFVYDLSLFCPIGPVLFDHPDPSLGTVLTSPSDLAGTANIDVVIFPERWLVAEDTFRPPWFHRNTMSEFMGLVVGRYDGKPGHTAGTMTLHNQFLPHGPSTEAFEAGTAAPSQPQRLTDTLAFMLESRYQWRVTPAAARSPLLDPDYPACWDGLDPA